MSSQYVMTGSETVAATPANITVELGFKPTYVRAINVNNLTFYEFWYGMTDDTSINTANHDTTQVSVNAAGGITLTDNGFTLGDDICDTAADVIRWFATR